MLNQKRHSFPKKLPKVIICSGITLKQYHELLDRGCTVVLSGKGDDQWKIPAIYLSLLPVRGK